MKSKRMVYFFISFLTLSTFLTVIPNSSGELILSESKIFNGLYADYDFEMGSIDPSSFNYVHDSGDIYNVTWSINSSAPAFWQEDLQTRLTSNVGGYGTDFGNGVHTPVWLFTNITLGDTIQIAVDGLGDYSFNVSDEKTVSYPGFGTLDVWVLQGFIYPASFVWYEKNTGLLINGSFFSFLADYNLTLTDTNMFSHYQPPSDGIPGYNLVVFLPLTILMTVLVLRKWRKKFINNK